MLALSNKTYEELCQLSFRTQNVKHDTTLQESVIPIVVLNKSSQKTHNHITEISVEEQNNLSGYVYQGYLLLTEIC